MFLFLKNIDLGFENREINSQFILWQYEYSTKQVQYILALTGMLYIVLGLSNIFLSPEHLKNILVPYQLFIIPSYLFLISYLSTKKTYMRISENLLISSPIIAALCHAYIFSKMDSYSTYQVELYLMLFWIFTISGLRFNKAIFAASIVFTIGEAYPYIAYENQYLDYFSHTIWMLVSMLLGLVGGYIFHVSQKNTFQKELELKSNAEIDTLTGLYNRSKLDSILTQELDKVKRYNHNIGVLLLDIDHFKNINDNYGHLVGDKILMGISQNIQSTIRSSDHIFRWGGEEFIIICPEINQTDLMTLAEKIRSQISQVHFDEVGYNTISIGVTINNIDDTVESIIKRADTALYEAKGTGRNKVCYR